MDQTVDINIKEKKVRRIKKVCKKLTEHCIYGKV